MRGELQLSDDEAAHDTAERDAALAAFGLVLVADAQQPRNPVFRLWPENEPSLLLWLDLSTQWRYAGMAGHRVGLDYTAALALVQRKPGIGNGAARWRCFEDLRAMEAAALDEMALRRR